MADSNVRIINDLRKFLERCSSDKSQKSKYVYKSSSFTRKRSLSMDILMMLILNTLKRSLSIELESFFEHFPQLSGCTKQAFSAQRSKLKPEFFSDWNNEFVSRFYQNYEDNFKQWKDMKLLAVNLEQGVLLPVFAFCMMF